MGLLLTLTGIASAIWTWKLRSEWEASSHPLCPTCLRPHLDLGSCPLVLGEE